MNSKLEPIENSIHLWSFQCLEHRDQDAVFSALLSPQEMERSEKLIQPQARQEDRLARGLLRSILASYIDAEPQNLAFERNEHGKPFIPNSPIRFNMSHSKGRLLIAVSAGRELGVDIEFRKKKLKPEPIVTRWFSSEEQAAFRKDADFFDLWAKKEAYVKALGTGIYKYFPTFTVPFPSIGKLDDWIFQTLEIDPNYAAALVYPAPEIPIHMCGFPDLGN